jgi:hypothetical protein
MKTIIRIWTVIGICILIGLCGILEIIKWCLWIPYMLLIFPFTGRAMHEYDLPMYPIFWIMELNEML